VGDEPDAELAPMMAAQTARAAEAQARRGDRQAVRNAAAARLALARVGN